MAPKHPAGFIQLTCSLSRRTGYREPEPPFAPIARDTLSMNSFRMTLFQGELGAHPAELREEEREAAQQGRLEIHCPHMNLSIQGSTELQLSGGGSISQQAEGPLLIKFYAQAVPEDVKALARTHLSYIRIAHERVHALSVLID